MYLNLSFTPNLTPKTIDELISESMSLKSIGLEHHCILQKSVFSFCGEFFKPENEEKNRYGDILCFDMTRVKITPKKGKNDYIHANYVGCFDTPKKYVVTQGPLKETVDQFWQLVWEQNSRIIVNLSELQVDGKEMCAPYWYPYDKQQIFQVDELSIKTVSETKNSGYLQTTFDVFNSITKESRMIKHYMYLDWPDNGIPSDLASFTAFIRDVDEEQRRLMKKKVVESAPIIVHCTAGVGRSGTFCAINSCIRELVKNETVSIPKAVLKVRQQRYASVLNENQYILIYRIIYEFAHFIRLSSAFKNGSCAD